MRTRPLRMRRITWPVSRGQKQLHIWNPRPRFAYYLCNFYWATTTIKGRLLSSVTNAKALDCVNFLCVTLWPWPLTFWPWTVAVHGEYVTNLATNYEDPTPIRSCVMSDNVFYWLPLKMSTRPLRMHRITWPVSRGQKQLHFWNLRPWFSYSLCTFGGSTMNVIKVICENNARPVLKNVWDSAHGRNHVICLR